jgi:hypothetical protein
MAGVIYFIQKPASFNALQIAEIICEYDSPEKTARELAQCIIDNLCYRGILTVVTENISTEPYMIKVPVVKSKVTTPKERKDK